MAVINRLKFFISGTPLMWMMCVCAVMLLVPGSYAQEQEVIDADHPPRDTRLHYPAFDMTIRAFQVQETLDRGTSEDSSAYTFARDDSDHIYLDVHADTLHLYTWVFNNISRKAIRVTPHQRGDSFSISFAVGEGLVEQYDPTQFIYQNYSSTADYDTALNRWDRQRARWQGVTPYRLAHRTSPVSFQLPGITEEAYRREVQRQLHLRDTLVDHSGESDNIATLVFKGHPAVFYLDCTYLRIQRYVARKLKETRYIAIEFSYGC